VPLNFSVKKVPFSRDFGRMDGVACIFFRLLLERYDYSGDIHVEIVGIWLFEVFGYKR